MDDLDDVLEAVVDVEDIVEELFDPDDLLEDYRAEPLKVVLALAAAAAAGFTLVMGLALVVLLALEYGLVLVLAGLTAIGLLLTVLSLAGFLYVRSDVPHRVQRKINHARAEAESSSTSDGSAGPEDDRTPEERAIERLREQYAAREITLREFEDRLEAVLESDDPESAVRERAD